MSDNNNNINKIENRYLWDWTKRDVDLARTYGLTRERVRQIRQSLGMPKSPLHRKGKYESMILINADFYKNKTVSEIAKYYNKKYIDMYKILKRAGIPFKRIHKNVATEA